MPSISDQELLRLRTSVEELRALNEIAAAINLSMSVQDISKIILENCLERIPASQSAIFLVHDNDGEEQGFHTFIRQVNDNSEDLPIHLNWSLVGWMSKNKQLLSLNNPVEDKRFPGINFTRLGISSLLAAPLISKSGLIGTLVLFNKKDSAGFTRGDKRFLGIVGTQTATVIENARLLEEERRLRALQEEMRVAKSIQDDYLPRNDLVAADYEVRGYSQAAKEVGGDYYDMFDLGNTQVLLSLGDVAGKGVPAALMASEAQAVIRSMLRQANRPTLSQLVELLNQLFEEMTRPDQYITSFLALYDNGKHLLRYVNAGHQPPLVVSKSGEISSLAGSDLIVGAFPGTSYTIHDQVLKPGDTLFMCSDGITENFNAANAAYGEDRLRQFLSERAASNLETIRSQLLTDLAEFRGKAPQSDDITFLMLRVR